MPGKDEMMIQKIRKGIQRIVYSLFFQFLFFLYFLFFSAAPLGLWDLSSRTGTEPAGHGNEWVQS